jgi:hypothetical protein
MSLRFINALLRSIYWNFSCFQRNYFCNQLKIMWEFIQAFCSQCEIQHIYKSSLLIYVWMIFKTFSWWLLQNLSNLNNILCNLVSRVSPLTLGTRLYIMHIYRNSLVALWRGLNKIKSYIDQVMLRTRKRQNKSVINKSEINKSQWGFHRYYFFCSFDIQILSLISVHDKS